MNNIDKDKDIKYVSKLTSIVKYKIIQTKMISKKIDCGMYNIKNNANMVKKMIHKASEMDNNTLHLIDDKLNEIIIYSKRILKISGERLELITDHLSDISIKK